MKKTVLLSVAVLVLLWAAPSYAREKVKFENPMRDWTPSQKVSYILGTQLGRISKDSDLDVDMKMVIKGLYDVIEGRPEVFTKRQASQIMKDFKKRARRIKTARLNAEAEKNLKEGKRFLEENRKKEGVHVTESGLQYRVLKEGDGPRPKVTDTVKVHYRGTLINGKEFDSSYRRGKPAEFPLRRVIRGWTEGLQLMKVGSKYVFYIPPDLAYGKAAPPSIGPDQTLIFEVELLDIVK